MSRITAEDLDRKLRESFDAQQVKFLSVEDTSDGCGAKFAVIIVSETFNEMTSIERHQAIMGNTGILATEMKTVSYLHY